MRKVVLNEVYKLAKKDSRVIFVGSDIGAGALDQFKAEMPDRFFMEGVSEAHIIGMMAGLAHSGKIPYLNTIAVFLTRRCYEQILLDVGLANLSVRLIGSGGGLVYAPLGPTHLAIDDIALMRLVPNMTILVPCDAIEMERLTAQTLNYHGPIYIRVAKGGDPVVSAGDISPIIGKAVSVRRGKDILLVTTGITRRLAMEAADILASSGIRASIVHVHTIKPFDREAIIKAASAVRAIVTIEEAFVHGGLGSVVSEVVADARFSKPKPILRIGLPDVFPDKYGSQQQLMEYYGITTQRIVEAAKRLMKKGSRPVKKSKRKK